MNATAPRSWIPIIGALLFLAPGLGMSIPFYLFTRESLVLATRGVAAEGTVARVRVITTDSRRNKHRNDPVVRFTTANGETIEFEAETFMYGNSFHKGDRIPVLYLRQQPRTAKINTFDMMWLLPSVFGFFCIPFTGVGISMLRKAILKSGR